MGMVTRIEVFICKDEKDNAIGGILLLDGKMITLNRDEATRWLMVIEDTVPLGAASE